MLVVDRAVLLARVIDLGLRSGEAGRIFDSTLAFTNGTNGFPELDNGQWVLSLEGPRQVNDRLRGEGVYDLALQNLQKAVKPPIVHMTLNLLNMDCMEEFIMP